MHTDTRPGTAAIMATPGTIDWISDPDSDDDEFCGKAFEDESFAETDEESED